MMDRRDDSAGGSEPEASGIDPWLVAVAGLALLNGLPGGPLFEPAFFLMRPLAASLSLGTAATLYATSLMLSALSALVAGIPAALYERACGLATPTRASMLVSRTWASSGLPARP